MRVPYSVDSVAAPFADPSNSSLAMCYVLGQAWENQSCSMRVCTVQCCNPIVNPCGTRKRGCSRPSQTMPFGIKPENGGARSGQSSWLVHNQGVAHEVKVLGCIVGS